MTGYIVGRVHHRADRIRSVGDGKRGIVQSDHDVAGRDIADRIFDRRVAAHVQVHLGCSLPWVTKRTRRSAGHDAGVTADPRLTEAVRDLTAGCSADAEVAALYRACPCACASESAFQLAARVSRTRSAMSVHRISRGSLSAPNSWVLTRS